MKKDREFKKFITVTILILCAFSLFSGVVTASERTEKAVFGIHSDTLTEADVINGVKRFLNDIKL